MTTLQILSLVSILILLLYLAPNILRRNRGVWLRNVAIWLGIAAVVALLYQSFGRVGP